LDKEPSLTEINGIQGPIFNFKEGIVSIEKILQVYHVEIQA